MKRFFGLLVLFLVAGGTVYIVNQENTIPPEVEAPKDAKKNDIPAVTVIAENLEIPWDIAFLPEGGMLVTERS